MQSMSINTDFNCKEPEQKPKAVAVAVTAHARQRFRERVGLPKNACQVQAQIVYDYGFTHTDAKGEAKEYLDRRFLKYKKVTQFRVYGGFIYIFCNTKLITTIRSPKGVLEGFKHCKAGKKALSTCSP